jgi:hypothetical protein
VFELLVILRKVYIEQRTYKTTEKGEWLKRNTNFEKEKDPLF